MIVAIAFLKIAAGSPRSQFKGDALRRSAQRQIEPAAQVLAAREGEPFDLAVALSKVEETTGNRGNAIAQAMATLRHRPAASTRRYSRR